jgi:WD40 repeat protein
MAQEVKPTLTTVRVETPLYKYVRAGSFSPDGRRLAVVASPTPYVDYRSAIYEIELPGGACVARFYDDYRCLTQVLHCGDAIIVAGSTITRGESLARLAGGRLEALDGDFPGASGGFPGPVIDLVRYAGGFVALRQRRHVRWDPDYREVAEDWLLFYDRRGRVRRAVPVPADASAHRWVPHLAVEPGSGQLAVADGEGVRIYGPSPDQVLASSRSPVFAMKMCFLGPQRLAVANGLGLKIWRVEDKQVFRSESDPASSFNVRDMVPVPSHRQIALLGSGLDGDVRYFDEETLAGPVEQGGLNGLRGTRLWGSPVGDAHALACGESTLVACDH